MSLLNTLIDIILKQTRLYQQGKCLVSIDRESSRGDLLFACGRCIFDPVTGESLRHYSTMGLLFPATTKWGRKIIICVNFFPNSVKSLSSHHGAVVSAFAWQTRRCGFERMLMGYILMENIQVLSGLLFDRIHIDLIRVHLLHVFFKFSFC